MKNEELENAIKVILNHCNAIGNEGVVASSLENAIVSDHRTIQQTFFRELNQFLVSYSEQRFDARNQSSVEFAQKVKELDSFFPYI